MRFLALILFCLLLPVNAAPQTYLNIKFIDDSFRNAELPDIEILTFDAGGNQLVIKLTDQSLINYSIDDIADMTLDDFPQGGYVPVELLLFEVVHHHLRSKDYESPDQTGLFMKAE